LYLGHFWSLSVEEQFYLFWPWLVFWIRDRKRLAWLCAAMVPLCLAMRLLGQHFLPQWMLNNEILFRATPFRLDALLLGGLLALAVRGGRREQLLRMARWAFPLAVALILAWLILRPHGHFWQRPYSYPSWTYTWGLSVIDGVSGLLILVALQPGTFIYKFLGLRPLRWIGRISYGAYVLHDIPHLQYLYLSTKIVGFLYAGSAVKGHALMQRADALTAVMALVSTLLLSWLSFRWFESAFLNLKERWTARVIH
jgi:peptidoglycan/LPS O-acetylase OafA/YrhL